MSVWTEIIPEVFTCDECVTMDWNSDHVGPWGWRSVFLKYLYWHSW